MTIVAAEAGASRCPATPAWRRVAVPGEVGQTDAALPPLGVLPRAHKGALLRRAGSCVRRCSDGNMSCNGVHGGIAWDRASWTIAVIDDEFDVWLTDACERPNLVANLVS